MQAPQDTITWFEIPVTNFERAKAFYEGILNITMPQTILDDFKMAFFYTQNPSQTTGALCYGEGFIPSGTGLVIYLNANPDLQNALNNVTTLGGRVLTTKTPIGPSKGYFAYILDSEGNRIALYSHQ